jgi:selenocysteine-specific elongation factor
VLTGRDADLRPVSLLDVRLDVEIARGTRVQVHHGTRDVPARVAPLGDGYYQLRLEKPLIAEPGDRLLLRQSAPVTTLGGGTVLDADVHKHGPGARVIRRLARIESGEPADAVDALPPPGRPPDVTLSATAAALERRLAAAGFEPPLNSAVDADDLAALRAAGRAVRVGPALHFHPEALATIEARVRALIDAEGSVTLGRLRDELATSRKFAQALLEHFDAKAMTVRRRDDSRVLRRRESRP